MVSVSVVVPVYNKARYLKRCLDSICAQTLKDIEIICVDDGSTDHSLQILKKYAEEDQRIKILTQENQFAGVARNHGMKHATGKYISFLDADDYFEPEMLERMFCRAEEDALDVVICRYTTWCQESGRQIIPDWSFADSFFIQKELFSGDSLKHAGIFQIAKGWAWDKLFRLEFVRQCGYEFLNFRSSEDGFFVYMLVARAKRLSYMDDLFVTYTVNDLASLSNTKEKDWMNGLKMLLLIKDEMERLNIYQVYQQSFLNEVVRYLDWYLKTMNSSKAFKNCYIYIQRVIEPEMGILSHSQEYYFEKKYYEKYGKIINLTLEEYFFEREKIYSKLLLEQREKINEQRKILERRALEEKAWVFPYRLIEKGKTIILYGAGKIGKSYYSQLIDSQFCKEVIWVDKKYDEYITKGMDVQSPGIIFQREYDFIFLAIKDETVQEEIKSCLLSQGVQPGKIRCYEDHRGLDR